MADEEREGYFKNQHGEWQVDRRKSDRRALFHSHPDHDRRKVFRRKADRELLEKDHRVMIKEALEEFAEEHSGKPSAVRNPQS